jgi:acetylornithine aminotransferase/acetylornithine/N-succinyldiaminopimelate aminotransferase
MTLEQLKEMEARLLLRTYDRTPIHFVGGEGAFLRDENGVEYLDFLSGIGVNALGYAHPAIEKAIVEQSTKLLHISNLFFHDGQAQLAEKLTAMTGMDRAFFCNSGTEAWEAAMKLARAYAAKQRSAGRPIGTKFLALEHSFHGRTMGSVSTTHKEKYRAPFAPLVETVEFVRFNDIADLRAKFSSDVCAVCVEAIQGEGGIQVVSEEFLQAARELTAQAGSLLICDEIQSGMGRTGEWCAYQHSGVRPDITTLAKPLAGGLPLGAMLCTEEVARAMEPGLHGTTFGGGPLACAVALAVIEEMEQSSLLQHVRETGSYFLQQLSELQERHDCIVDVRGAGLMIGIELENAEIAAAVAAEMLKQHVLINRTSDVVLRFLPPYVITQQQVDRVVLSLDNALSLVAAPVAAGGNKNGY